LGRLPALRANGDKRLLPGIGDSRIGLPRGGFQLPDFTVLMSPAEWLPHKFRPGSWIYHAQDALMALEDKPVEDVPAIGA
jgi:hypothetical protein